MNIEEIPGHDVLTEDHRRIAREMVEEHHRHDGMIPMDLERFWTDNAVAKADPFGADIPQVCFGAVTWHECVYDELGVEPDFWRYWHDEDWRLELNRAYNDRAERIIGKRLLSEQRREPGRPAAEIKQLHDVFEARREWISESWWLMESAHNEAELEALLDRVEARDIRSFILPENWEEEKERLKAEGRTISPYRGQRGPVTFATSIYGPENLIMLILEHPDLAARFRDAILHAMLEIARVRDEEAGHTPETAPHGFGFADDNCCLLTPEMYEFFGYPILKAVFDRYSPDPGDKRYQHSDSAMGHLLPILGRLNMTGVNFGPTLTVREIREHMPHAVIDGQLSPLAYMRNEEERCVLEFLRDYTMARETRGLNFRTAGSVNNGTLLTTMRLLMATVQRHGRYDS